MTQTFFKENNENASLCAKCGGTCCKRMPGLFTPEDFGLPENVEGFKKRFKEERLSVDWWEGDIRFRDFRTEGFALSQGEKLLTQTSYVRPPVVGASKVFDPTWGGACAKHSKETGCSLKFEDRPYECRNLVPIESMQCKLSGDTLSKEQIIELWLPYQDLIVEVGRQLQHQIREEEETC